MSTSRLIFILFLVCEVQGFSRNKSLDFKLSEDYIYKIYPNEPERYFNPQSLIIVRNISFLQIKSSLEALRQLTSKLEQTCSQIEALEAEGSKNYDYEFISGTFDLSSAKDACATKGKN